MMGAQFQQRQQRAQAARLLLTLYGQGALEEPSRWTWEAVDRLPAWCLADAPTRVQLQQVCGALYLSPEIRFWIDKPLLQAVSNTIGDAVFANIMQQADAMQHPREALAEVMEQAGFTPASASAEQVQALLTAAGATVLSATVHESLPRDMLVDSLGAGVGEISHSAAQVLHNAAQNLIESCERQGLSS